MPRNAAPNSATVRRLTLAIEAEKSPALLCGVIALVEAGNKDSWVSTARDFFVSAPPAVTPQRLWLNTNFVQCVIWPARNLR